MKIHVEKVKGQRVPWRIRWKAWWFNHWTIRKFTDEQRKLLEQLESRLERAYVFGYDQKGDE